MNLDSLCIEFQEKVESPALAPKATTPENVELPMEGKELSSAEKSPSPKETKKELPLPPEESQTPSPKPKKSLTYTVVSSPSEVGHLSAEDKVISIPTVTVKEPTVTLAEVETSSLRSASRMSDSVSIRLIETLYGGYRFYLAEEER